MSQMIQTSGFVLFIVNITEMIGILCTSLSKCVVNLMFLLCWEWIIPGASLQCRHMSVITSQIAGNSTVRPTVQANFKGNNKDPHHWPLGCEVNHSTSLTLFRNGGRLLYAFWWCSPLLQGTWLTNQSQPQCLLLSKSWILCLWLWKIPNTSLLKKSHDDYMSNIKNRLGLARFWNTSRSRSIHPESQNGLCHFLIQRKTGIWIYVTICKT